jgi:hypothetical protein
VKYLKRALIALANAWVAYCVITLLWQAVSIIEQKMAAAPNRINLQEQALPPVVNSAVFATHNQIQQASDIRCQSTLQVQAYACPVGAGPNPTIGTPVLGMEIQFIADVPCVASRSPFPCTVNVENSGLFSVFVNDGSTVPTPATFGPGFHRMAGDLIANQIVWRLEY